MIFPGLIFRFFGHGNSAVPVLPSTIRGKSYQWPSGAYQCQRLASDSIGTTTITLTNVAVGSAYRVELQSDGTLVAAGTAGASTVVLSGLPYYTAGNSNNDVRIKVRKGTAAPKYQPFETLATLSSVAQSIYIAQVPDSIA